MTDFGMIDAALENVRLVGREDGPEAFTAPSVLQLRREGVPPREDVVPGVLPRAGMLQVLGPPKEGLKTWAMLHLALAAVRGDVFLHWPLEPTRVLYLTGEGGVQLVLERLEKMAPEDEPELENLHVWAPSVGMENLDLTDPDVIAAIVSFCLENEIALVIVDPLVEFHYADENSTSEMRHVIACLRTLTRQANVGLALAHHTSKSGAYKGGSPAQGRGSTALWGAVDASIVMEPRGTGKARVSAQLRWAPDPEPLQIILDPDTCTFIVEDAPTRKALDPEEVARILAEGPASRDQISAALKAEGLPSHVNTISAALKELGERVTHRTGPHGKHIYRLTEEVADVPF